MTAAAIIAIGKWMLVAAGIAACLGLICLLGWVLWQPIGPWIDARIESQFGDEPGRFE